MSALLESVKEKVADFLEGEGYSKRGKNEFVLKEKEHGREQVITFSSRNGRAPHTDYIYIGVASGIYYKKVNSQDKKVIGLTRMFPFTRLTEVLATSSALPRP